jgi:hypothetical protein
VRRWLDGDGASIPEQTRKINLKAHDNTSTGMRQRSFCAMGNRQGIFIVAEMQ